jgi:hypothetical protein
VGVVSITQSMVTLNLSVITFAVVWPVAEIVTS